MADKELSKRRRVENELVFKQLNQQVKQAAEVMLPNRQRREFPLKFYCECSNESCTERIMIPLEDYAMLHQNIRNFMVLPGHQQSDIEQVVSDQGKFVIAKKDKELFDQVSN